MLALLIAAPGSCELMETARVPGVLLEGFGAEKEEGRGMKEEGGVR